MRTALMFAPRPGRGVSRRRALELAGAAGVSLLAAGCAGNTAPQPSPGPDLRTRHNEVAALDIPAHLVPAGITPEDLFQVVDQTARAGAAITGEVNGDPLTRLMRAVQTHDVAALVDQQPQLSKVIDGVTALVAKGPADSDSEDFYVAAANTLASLIMHQAKTEFLSDALALEARGEQSYPPEALETTRTDWQAATTPLGPVLYTSLLVTAADRAGIEQPVVIANSLADEIENRAMTTPIEERIRIVRVLIDANLGTSLTFVDPRGTVEWERLTGVYSEAAFQSLQAAQLHQAASDVIQGLLVFGKEGS